MNNSQRSTVKKGANNLPIQTGDIEEYMYHIILMQSNLI